MGEKYNVWDYMKTTAIVLVVLGHVTRMYTAQGILDIGIHPTLLRLLTSLIYSFHMPAFFAVSGAVYYINKVEKQKYQNKGTFILNKARRLMIPYLVFALLWVFPTMWYMGFVESPVKYFIDSYFFALNPRHLWFLIVLFEIFVVFCLFQKQIHNHRWLTLIVLFLCWFLADLMPVTLQLSNLFRYTIYFYVGYLFVPYCNYIDYYLMGEKRIFMLLGIMLLWVTSHLVAYYFRSVMVVFPLLSLVSALFGTLMLYMICHVGGGIYSNSRLYKGLRSIRLEYIYSIL